LPLQNGKRQAGLFSLASIISNPKIYRKIRPGTGNMKNLMAILMMH
jgi:hypothetical protein